MVAFLLQTTSSEDLCSEPLILANSATGPPHAVLQCQQLLSRAPGDGAPASLQPPHTAATVQDSYDDEDTVQPQDLFSVAQTATRSSASEGTAAGRPDVDS